MPLFLRKFLAGVTLIIFSLSITPTHLLHNYFANHKDGDHFLCGNELEKTSLHKTSTYCKCVDLVANAPFDGIDHWDIPKPLVVFYTAYNSLYKNQYKECCHVTTQLRGPPYPAILPEA